MNCNAIGTEFATLWPGMLFVFVSVTVFVFAFVLHCSCEGGKCEQAERLSWLQRICICISICICNCNCVYIFCICNCIAVVRCEQAERLSWLQRSVNSWAPPASSSSRPPPPPLFISSFASSFQQFFERQLNRTSWFWADANAWIEFSVCWPQLWWFLVFYFSGT